MTTRTTVVVATTTSRSERRRWRRLVGFAVLALGGFTLACDDKPKGGPEAGTVAVDLSPVPEPKGLAATFVVGKPGEAWGKLRETGGGPARLLPQSFGLLVSMLLGLPAAAAEAIDADVPMTGAASADASGAVQVAVAIHVRSGRELTAQLTAGADALYSARAHAETGMTLIEPKPGKASTEVSLAILGNYLLASRHAADLTEVGPYAARTLSKEPPPKRPISLSLRKSALSGPVASTLRDAWKSKKAELEQLDGKNRQTHGGRAPDFGDPAAAIAALSGAVDSFVKVLESADAGRIVVEPLGDRLEVMVELDAAKEGAAAEIFSGFALGDAAPIGALPAATPIAVLVRTSSASREASAKNIEQGLGDLFGDRLSAPDREKVKGVLDKLSRGRGDWETYGVYVEAGKGGAVYRASTTDAKQFDAGAKDLFKLLSVKALGEPLRQFAGEISVKQSSAQIPGVPGTAQRTLLGLKPSPMRTAADKSGKVSAETQDLELLWAHKDGRVFGAGSLDAVPILGVMVAADSDEKASHKGDAKVAAALSRVKDASFVVLVQPLRLGAGTPSATPGSPVVVSLGRRDRTGFLRAEADQAALESLLKSIALSR